MLCPYNHCICFEGLCNTQLFMYFLPYFLLNIGFLFFYGRSSMQTIVYGLKMLHPYLLVAIVPGL